MADFSFKQANELIERLEFVEITLKDTLGNINDSSNNFKASLKEQENILMLQPKFDNKLNNMKIIVALNIGLCFGLLIGKFFL